MNYNKLPIDVPGKWVQVDFHVHTPNSPDFQKKHRNDVGYNWFLEEAKSSNIDIIVITDHNSIDGYFKILEIKNDLSSTKKTLEITNSQIPQNISNLLSIFEKINFLPGAELDVYPNIHVLILFDPQTKECINDFLTRAGCKSSTQNDENHNKWTISQVYYECEKIGALVIGAHVDSDKGLYEETKTWGKNRIDAFCNENLYGMEFNNPVAKDQIENLMKVENYTRNSKIAFVQSSDFHGKPDEKIGKLRTYVRMDNLSQHEDHIIFEALKNALRNPDEFISAPSRPEIKLILNKLNEKQSIESLQTEEDKQKLNQFICAYSNTENNTITIGRNLKNNWIGQSEMNESAFINKITNTIETGITPKPNVDIQVYPYYENKFIASIRVKKQPQVCYLTNDDSVYILDSGKPKKATNKEIIDMVENSLLERYSNISITKKLSRISKNLLGTEDSIDILPIVRKIDKVTLHFNEFFNIPDFGEIITSKVEEGIDLLGNGYKDGNIIVLSNTKPRYTECYFRLSAPIGKCRSDILSSFDNKYFFSNEKILISPGGGVNFDNHDNIVVASYLISPLVFTSKNKNKPCNMKFIIAFLKSSVCIWYSYRCLGSFDLRNIKIIQNIPIPNIFDQSFENKVMKLIDEIYGLEEKYLENFQELLVNYPDLQARQSDSFTKSEITLREQHNKLAGKLIGQIDSYFYDFFNLTTTEIMKIESFLESSGFANFNSSHLG